MAHKGRQRTKGVRLKDCFPYAVSESDVCVNLHLGGRFLGSSGFHELNERSDHSVLFFQDSAFLELSAFLSICFCPGVSI